MPNGGVIANGFGRDAQLRRNSKQKIFNTIFMDYNNGLNVDGLTTETNALNNLFGGELLARMDRAASISAGRHSRRIAVTVSVNHVAFNKAIPLGSVVIIEAKVSREIGRASCRERVSSPV